MWRLARGQAAEHQARHAGVLHRLPSTSKDSPMVDKDQGRSARAMSRPGLETVTITIPRWLAEEGDWEGLDHDDLVNECYQQLVDQDCWLNKGDPGLQGNGYIKNYAAVALGRIGGRIGGRARAAALSPERRSEIARNAAIKRWSAKGIA